MFFPLYFHVIVDDSFAITGYELERDYWKNRKDLSSKERVGKQLDAYDSRYGKSDQGSGNICCIAVIIAIATGVFLGLKDKKTIADLSVFASKNGFSINQEKKKCPRCFETIKLQSKKCIYCEKSFSGMENQKSLKFALESYIEEKGLSYPPKTVDDYLTNNNTKVKVKNSAKEWTEKGFMLYKSGEYKEAVIAFSYAINYNNNDAHAYYLRAAAYKKMNDQRKFKNDLLISAKLGHVKAIEYLNKNNHKI